MPATKKYPIVVQAIAIFEPEYSDPSEEHYCFTYSIVIENCSSYQVQLISRHWIISDALGRLHEVNGEGVIGRQPTLDPGEVFSYTSSCVLPTPAGSMRGSYAMIALHNGERFDAPIDEFMLAIPEVLH